MKFAIIFLAVLFVASVASPAPATEVDHPPKFMPDATQRSLILNEKAEDFRYPGSALVNAVREHFLDVIVSILNRPGVREKEGQEAVLVAIASKDPEALSVILATGVSPNLPGGGGAETLTYAMAPGEGRAICVMADYGLNISPGRYPNFPLLTALNRDNLQSAQLLRRLGYQPGQRELELISTRAKKRDQEALWAAVLKIPASEDAAVTICADMFAVRPR